MVQREKPKALVIDDSHVDRIVIERLLEKLGCQVDSVKGGVRGVALHTTKPFDIMFIDIVMPMLDGCDTAQLVQAASNEEDIPPMIAVTGLSNPAEQKRCIELGMSAVIDKPPSEASLSAILRQFINWPPDDDER